MTRDLMWGRGDTKYTSVSVYSTSTFGISDFCVFYAALRFSVIYSMLELVLTINYYREKGL